MQARNPGMGRLQCRARGQAQLDQSILDDDRPHVVMQPGVPEDVALDDGIHVDARCVLGDHTLPGVVAVGVVDDGVPRDRSAEAIEEHGPRRRRCGRRLAARARATRAHPTHRPSSARCRRGSSTRSRAGLPRGPNLRRRPERKGEGGRPATARLRAWCRRCSFGRRAARRLPRSRRSQRTPRAHRSRRLRRAPRVEAHRRRRASARAARRREERLVGRILASSLTGRRRAISWRAPPVKMMPAAPGRRQHRAPNLNRVSTRGVMGRGQRRD
jgi:hypothetical protein